MKQLEKLLRIQIEFESLIWKVTNQRQVLLTPGLLSRARDTLVAYTMKHVATHTQDVSA